jgi:hypothetical protein
VNTPLFRATWDLIDVPVPLSHIDFVRLQVQASGEIDDLADSVGCRIAGPVAWFTRYGKLVAEAPAVVLDREVAA